MERAGGGAGAVRARRQRLLRPDEQVFEAMLAGWRDQQLSRNLGEATALRDAAALKTAYAFGLRRRELVMLDLADFGANPHAPEFGDYGVVYVRWGKASKGSPPKRRSVLTVFPWSVRVLRQWVEQFRGLFDQAASGGGALWPSERSPRVSLEKISARFADYRDALGLPDSVSLHSLRHSYITHLIEDGYDPLFVQAGGPLLRLDHRAVHVGVVGLPQPGAAGGAGPVHPGRPRRGCRMRDGGSVMARRKLDFHWNLRRLMAAHQMWKTTDLIPLLRERGAELSASQVYRLVTDKPERLSMKVLIALCDILDCTPADLIDPYAEPAARRKTAGEPAAAVVELKPGPRPERARILDEE